LIILILVCFQCRWSIRWRYIYRRSDGDLWGCSCRKNSGWLPHL